MPGPQRQVLNQDVVGGGKGRKKVSDPVAIESKSVRRIRLLLNDPDATDSSGDEENGDPVLYIKKRIVHEIPLVPLRQKSVPSPSSSLYPICAPRNLDTLRTLKLRRVAPSESSSRFKGVRQRRWGKWAAEIRDPIRGIRKWLGTYDSAEEAAKAYQEAFRRIQAEKLRLQHPCVPAPTSPASSSISERTISLSSPSSVLDVSAPVISSAQRRPADLLLAPQVEGFEERLIADLFGQHHLVPAELDFSLGVESDELLVGNLDDDFIGLGDLPLWAPQFDGGDLAFLD